MQVSGLGQKPGEAEDTGRAGHSQEDTLGWAGPALPG